MGGELRLPGDDLYGDLLAGTGPKVAASTTGAFTRLLRALTSGPGPRTPGVPIIPDEARTFGIDGLFREIGIYQPGGQLYEPVDAGLLLSYTEKADGQILEEGITEAGSMASTIAAGTSYATFGEPMIPFFVHYSMFGFHRAGDLIWAFGDIRGRGFLMAATAGRTTLQGEGLQHCDGHSLLYASTLPSCRAYDPAFAYEVAVIVRAGLESMYGADPRMSSTTLPCTTSPIRCRRCLRGSRTESFRVSTATRQALRALIDASILASGPAILTALDAQRVLAERYEVAAEVWSATSYKALRDDALTTERWNRLHPAEIQRVPHVARVSRPRAVRSSLSATTPRSCPIRSPAGCLSHSSYSVPRALVFPTQGLRCGDTSRWTRTT